MTDVILDKAFTEETGEPNLLLQSAISTPRVDQSLITGALMASFIDILQIFEKSQQVVYTPSVTITTHLNAEPRYLALLAFPTIDKYFAGIRADTEFQIHVQSHFQQVGAVLAVQKPLVTLADTVSWAGCYPAAPSTAFHFEYANQIIPFGKNGNYTMSIPWYNPENFLSFSNDLVHNSGSVRLIVIEQMRVAAGVTPTSTFTIWSRLKNITLVGYVRT